MKRTEKEKRARKGRQVPRIYVENCHSKPDFTLDDVIYALHNNVLDLNRTMMTVSVKKQYQATKLQLYGNNSNSNISTN